MGVSKHRSRFWRVETIYIALAVLPPVLLLFLAGPTILFWTAVSFENVERLARYARDADSSFRFEAAEELTLIWRTSEPPAPELDLVVANLRDSAEDPQVRARFRERIDDFSGDYAEKRAAISLQSIMSLLRSEELEPARGLVQSDTNTAELGVEPPHGFVGQSEREGFSEPEVVDLVLEFWWDPHDRPVLDVGSVWRFGSRYGRRSVWNARFLTPTEIDRLFEGVERLGVVVEYPKRVSSYGQGFVGGIDSWQSVCKDVDGHGAFIRVASLFVVDLRNNAVVARKLGVAGSEPPFSSTGCIDIGTAPNLDSYFAD